MGQSTGLEMDITAYDVSVSLSDLSAASPPDSGIFPSRTSTNRSSCQFCLHLG